MDPVPHSSILPQMIALFNGCSFLCLLAGLVAVKKRYLVTHRYLMSSAFIFSSFFLVLYLVHHYKVGSVPYAHHDWTRTLYFLILIPHVILSVVMLPFIFLAFRSALRNEFEKHRRIVRFAYPMWIFVSFTGLIVYFMLYHL